MLAFRGIPYAQTPTGALRWRPPVDERPWAGVRDARKLGPDAVQFGDGSGFFDDEPRPESEDSLVVNVWTPELEPARQPIMVFIHGGGFSFGGSGRQLYDGRYLASEGRVVVVSLNYRLGPLGLLTHPVLAEGDTGYAGNWALFDQIAALRWVREHAAAIGGDANAVTIFGESAGSVSVGVLCVLPEARGLFRRAIMQSGAPRTIPREQAEKAAEAYYRALGVPVTNPGALRSLSVDRLKEASQVWLDLATRKGYAPRPSVDGKLLTDEPLALAAAGATHEIELVVGTNRDELNMSAMRDPQDTRLTETELAGRVAALVGTDYPELDSTTLIETYHDARAEQGLSVEAWWIFAAISSDCLVRLDSLRFLEQHIAGGGTGYAYHFDWESPNPLLGSCHGMELPFCFGTLTTAPGMAAFAGAGVEAESLRQTMIKTWCAFARGEGEPFGPVFDTKKRSTWRLGKHCGPIAAPMEIERRAWGER